MKNWRWMFTYLCVLRVLPAYVFFRNNRFAEKCSQDLAAWVQFNPTVQNHSEFWQLAYLLIYEKALRNIFLNRLHRNPVMYVIIRVLFSPLESCYLNMPPEKVGGGLYFQHGFSTIVSAKEIGERCSINQQVTIGFKDEDAPVIGDDVSVTAGAIIIGNVNVGDGSVVGAGAVVTNDVPSNATVVGVPARAIIRGN